MDKELGQSGVCVRRLGGDRAGEVRIGRFLRNPRVTPGEMFRTAAERTAGLVEGRHILAIQDTTTLHDDGRLCSLLLHPTIAVDAEHGALYGLIEAEFLHRAGGKKADHKKRPFAEKQSCRWLRGAEAAASLREAGAARVTVIADREGDIYEEFALRPTGVDLLIRAAQDRCLADGTMLFACTQGLAPLGRTTVDLPAAPGRRKRTATLELRARQVALRRPGRPAAEKANLPTAVWLTLVEAHEIDAPAGIAPAHWFLLTTHGVHSLMDACTIVGFYRQRWTIEQLFRTCKTKGFDIEAVRMEDDKPFENLAAAILIAAIQVMQLVRDRDGEAKRPLSDAFDPQDQPLLSALSQQLQGKTERQKNPHPEASLAHAAWVIARLGGWTGYYGKPGPVVTLHGLNRFNAIRIGWKTRTDV